MGTEPGPAWPAGDSEMAERIRTHDWAATPLGPIARWPQSLKTAVEVMLGAPHMAHVCWGPAFTTLYNDAFIPLMGPRHPSALGRPMTQIWPRPEVDAMARATLAGVPQRFADQLFEIPLRTEQPIGWFTGGWTPLRDETGAIVGFLASGFETTGRVLAERAQRENEARQRFLVAFGDALRPLADPVAVQREAMRLLGEHLDADRCYYFEADHGAGEYVLSRDYVRAGASLAARYPFKDWPRMTEAFLGATPLVVPDIAEATAIGDERQPMEALGIRAMIVVSLVKQGRFVAGLAVTQAEPRAWTEADVELVQDVAERTWASVARARAEAAVREDEARLRTIFDALPVGVALMDIQGQPVLLNEEMRRYLPQGRMPSRDPVERERWTAHDAEGRKLTPDEFPGQRASRGERVVPGLEMLYTPAKGRPVWTRIAAVPMVDVSGRQTGQFAVATDIDDLKRAQERQSTLLKELQHRVRNTLAMVRSIIFRTLENAQSLDEVGPVLEGRINALARTQAALTRAAGAGAGVDLEMLVRDELLAQAAREAQVSVEGPVVLLAPKAAEVLTLAIHELATNSIKYGALGGGAGEVSVRWWTTPAPQGGSEWLHLTWTEAGVRVLTAAPRHRGFGVELLERRVPYELKGSGRMELRPGGLHAEIAFPLTPGESILATETPATAPRG